MRQANSDYYRRNVEPAVHLEDLLKRAVNFYSPPQPVN
jgi:hypothetical protein